MSGAVRRAGNAQQFRRIAEAVEQAATEGLYREALELQAKARESLGSGPLADSIVVKPVSGGRGFSIGTAQILGRLLEFGTRRMAARPWLFPAWQQCQEGLGQRLTARLSESIGRMTER
jgi:hypothetical protein